MEAQPTKSEKSVPVRQSLAALGGGKAADLLVYLNLPAMVARTANGKRNKTLSRFSVYVFIRSVTNLR